jgi:hypothetical protein
MIDGVLRRRGARSLRVVGALQRAVPGGTPGTAGAQAGGPCGQSCEPIPMMSIIRATVGLMRSSTSS